MKSPKYLTTSALELPNTLPMTKVEDDIVGDLTHEESSHFPIEPPPLPVSFITRRTDKPTRIEKALMCQI